MARRSDSPRQSLAEIALDDEPRTNSPVASPVAAAVGLAILMVTGLALRLPHLYDPDLWLDELIQVYIAKASIPGSLWATDPRDRNPPLSPLLSWAASAVRGEWKDARLVSLVAGLAAIPLGWAAGRLFAGPAAGWLTEPLSVSVLSMWPTPKKPAIADRSDDLRLRFGSNPSCSTHWKLRRCTSLQSPL